MPRMKYFQQIANISDSLDSWIDNISYVRSYDSETQAKLDGRSYPSDEEFATQIQEMTEESTGMKYLVACQTNHSWDGLLEKPSKDVLIRGFNRRLKDIEIQLSKTQNPDYKKYLLKHKKCCQHYLFRFEYDVWYDKLPNEIR